jgi:CDP-diacylglycerol--serine O-phosphatidyltransferase
MRYGACHTSIMRTLFASDCVQNFNSNSKTYLCRMFGKAIIPNTLTMLNLVMGCAALLAHNVQDAFLFVLIAAFADLLDGLVARAIGASSEMGKQLDSLADVVSFGVVPAFWLYKILQPEIKMWAALAFLLAVAAAFRLARFNLDTSKSTGFKGLPVPANGLFWLSVLSLTETEPLSNQILVGLILLFAFLMASTLPLLSFKFSNFSWKENAMKFILIGSIVLSAIGAHFILKKVLWTVPIALLLYLILSAVQHLFGKQHEKV